MTPFRARCLSHVIVLPCILAATSTQTVHADFVRMDVRNVTAELDTPPGLRTYRVFALFDDPADAIESIWSSPEDPFSIYTDDPEGLRNDAGPLAGLPGDDLPNAPTGASWDSWVTIGGDELGTPVLITPGFAGTEEEAVFLGSSVVSEFGGWTATDGAVAAGDDGVLVAQFTIGDASHFDLRGLVSWITPDGGLEETRFACSSRCPAASWPSTTVSVTCDRPDVTGDGTVGFDDVLEVIARFGSCPRVWRFLEDDDDGTRHEVAASVIGCTDCPVEIVTSETGRGWFASEVVASGATGIATASVEASRTVLADRSRFFAGATALAIMTGACGDPMARVTSSVRWSYRLQILEPVDFAFSGISALEGELFFGGTAFGGFVQGSADLTGTLVPGDLLVVGGATLEPAPGEGPNALASAALDLFDGGCLADVDADGAIDFTDLLAVLADWGDCGG